ncbi:MAG TPA: hypothetical protein VMS99_06840 [Acidimicrobiia bacterium]|nr:hypothetical protein [Acidimicrobiia bacterium]
MGSRRHIPEALIVLLVMAGCGVPATAPSDDFGSQGPTTVATVKTTGATTTTATVEIMKTDDTKNGTSKVEAKTDFDCPVTIPSQPGFVATKSEKVTYSKQFPPPDPWPSEYPHKGIVWHGSEDLWTALAIEGDHGGRKSVWWSVNFPGGVVEEQPDVSVAWTRLDTDQPVVIDNGGEATNAYTPEEGWFMIAGIDPDEPGCWEVEAAYKGASLSYVYEKTE